MTLNPARVACLCALTVPMIIQGLAPVELKAQVQVSGQASSAFMKAWGDPSQYSYNAGRGRFAWRGDLFADALLSERITFHGSLRMLQDQDLHVDLFSLGFSDLTPLHLTVDAGEIELPVGNLGVRRYPMNNQFLDLPLVNEHMTSLRNTDYWLYPNSVSYGAAWGGVRILDQGLYDIGGKVSGSAWILDYSLALVNGTVSTSGAYGRQDLSAEHRFGKIFRLTCTPVVGLTVGSSYADGVLSSASGLYADSVSPAYTSTHTQRLAEVDVDFSYGHLSIDGQLLRNSWDFENTYGSNLTATGFSAEALYRFLPRLTFAARVGGLFFNSIEARLPWLYSQSGYYEGPWDHDVTRLEAAVSYRLSRESVMKLVYMRTHTDDIGGGGGLVQVLGVQTAVSF